MNDPGVNFATLANPWQALNDGLDLAALAVDAQGLQVIAIGDAGAPRPGQWVLALGHPWGVRGAVTAGVVAGVGVGLPEMPLPGREWTIARAQLRPG